jgi:hypothetical protein
MRGCGRRSRRVSTWSHLTVCLCARSQVIPRVVPFSGSLQRALRSILTPHPDDLRQLRAGVWSRIIDVASGERCDCRNRIRNPVWQPIRISGLSWRSPWPLACKASLRQIGAGLAQHGADTEQFLRPAGFFCRQSAVPSCRQSVNRAARPCSARRRATDRKTRNMPLRTRRSFKRRAACLAGRAHLRLTPERMGHQDRRAPDSRGADRYARRKAAFFEVLAGGAAGIASAFLARRNALSLAVLR